jgi:hypothetical protein
MKIGEGGYEVVLINTKEEWVNYLVSKKCQYRVMHDGDRFAKDLEHSRLKHEAPAGVVRAVAHILRTSTQELIWEKEKKLKTRRGRFEVAFDKKGKQRWAYYLVSGEYKYWIGHNGERFARNIHLSRLMSVSGKTVAEIEQLIKVGLL